MNGKDERGTRGARLLRDHGHLAALAALLLVVLLYRLATLPMIEMGGDAVKAWFNAKQITLSITDRYWVWDHHSVRFAFIVPVWLSQEIFGLRPSVYYVVPLAAALAQAALLFAIGRRLNRPMVGFLAALAVLLFPPSVRSSQLLGEAPSAVWSLVGLYLLLRYRDATTRRAAWLVAMAVALYLAWLTKVTNVLWVPAFALAIGIVGRRWKDATLFCAVLFGLFCVETLLYAALTEHRLGQLDVVRGSHLQDRRLKATPLAKLFTHFAGQQAIWRWTLGVFSAATVIAALGWRRLGKEAAVIALLPASFLLLQNFAVKSIDPLVPVQRFLSRYFVAAVPLLALTVTLVAALLLEKAVTAIRRRPLTAPGWVWPVIGALALVGVCGLAAKKYPGEAKHPLALLARYDAEGNRAFNRGMPLIALRTAKNADFFLKVLWTGMRSRKVEPKLLKIEKGKLGREKVSLVVHPDHRKGLGKKAQGVIDASTDKKVILATNNTISGKESGSAFEMKITELKKKK